MAKYAAAARLGGAAPAAFVSNPTTTMGFDDYFNCSADGSNNRWLPDGTSIVRGGVRRWERAVPKPVARQKKTRGRSLRVVGLQSSRALLLRCDLLAQIATAE